jgi:hypothetical protein
LHLLQTAWERHMKDMGHTAVAGPFWFRVQLEQCITTQTSFFSCTHTQLYSTAQALGAPPPRVRHHVCHPTT